MNTWKNEPQRPKPQLEKPNPLSLLKATVVLLHLFWGVKPIFKGLFQLLCLISATLEVCTTKVQTQKILGHCWSIKIDHHSKNVPYQRKRVRNRRTFRTTSEYLVGWQYQKPRQTI